MNNQNILIIEKEQFNDLINNFQEEIRILKQDIKLLLRENEAKEKVIVKQNNILSELNKLKESDK